MNDIDWCTFQIPDHTDHVDCHRRPVVRGPNGRPRCAEHAQVEIKRLHDEIRGHRNAARQLRAVLKQWQAVATSLVRPRPRGRAAARL